MEVDRLICGEASKVMPDFPDACIDLTVTSPPYDNLRDYHGYEFDFEAIADELYRVTKDGGAVVWVVGDGTRDFCESLSSFKQAIYFVEACGFNLLDTMIYHKLNYAPAYPTMLRYAQTFEYMFVFSKGKPSAYNPIQKPKAESSLQRYKYGGFIFAKQDGSRTRAKQIEPERETKDACNVWSYGVGHNKSGHPAPFPDQLAIDHVLSWSNEGDLVLDPMCGSGTTCKAAVKLRRRFIGIDISEEYCEIGRQRIEAEMAQLTLL